MIQGSPFSMLLRLLLLLMLFSVMPLRAADAPRVVVTIAPIHSLVAGVMAGVGTPEQLVKGAASPHTYMLKPSQMASLQGADLIIWNGESVESFMPRTLHAVAGDTRVIKLAAVQGMRLLPTRSGGLWVEENHDHDHHRGQLDGQMDGHLWLDPENAKVIVKVIGAALSEIDPSNATLYRRNSELQLQRLGQLNSELDRSLAPLRKTPYLVFHDGYHYFEDRFHLNAAGAISVDPEHKPGARRLRELTAMIRQKQVRCVFSEPQFPVATVQTITAGSGVKSGVLDPLGSTLPAGPELYFTLMRNLGKSLAECLQ